MATLKVKIEESVLIENERYNNKRVVEIESIDEVFKRVVTCPASATTTLAVFNAAVSGADGAINIGDSRYIRITNLASTSVELAVVGSATLYQVKLDSDQSHILGSADDLMLAEADTSPSFGSMADLASIKVNPGSSAANVEIFIASAG